MAYSHRNICHGRLSRFSSRRYVRRWLTINGVSSHWAAREGQLHSAVGNVTVLLFWFGDIGVRWSASHTAGGVAEIAVFAAP